MAEWTYYISLAIPSDDQSRLLLFEYDGLWRQPVVILHALFNNLYILPRTVHEQFGLDVTILRTLARQVDEEAHTMQAIWLVENHTRDWNPPQNARWINRAELDGLVLADEWMRPALENILDTLTDAPPPQRPPWFMPGWFATAEAWIDSVLTAKGYEMLRPPEHFKHGTISSVLRTETSAGNIYFKVALTLPLFGHEPTLTTALGELYPDIIPSPLAIDKSRRWMLTADIGTELRTSNPSLEMLEMVVKTFAHLQSNSASHIDSLFAAGCLDRRLDVLVGQIDGLLADEGCCTRLTAEERAEWQASGDQLKVLCQRLASYAIPYTLVHGDFHAGNIALQGEKIRFFDWTDACVTHPFFDLPVLIEYDAQEHADALRDAYLAEWTAYESLERLHEAYAISSILGSLHQAVSYQGIFNGMEVDQRSGWDFGVPTFARRILKEIKTLPTI